jgi:hypothetical protein
LRRGHERNATRCMQRRALHLRRETETMPFKARMIALLLATTLVGCVKDDTEEPPAGAGGNGGSSGIAPLVECLAGNRARFKDGREQDCGDEYVCKPEFGCPSSCTTQADCMENHQCAKLVGDELGRCNFVFPD